MGITYDQSTIIFAKMFCPLLLAYSITSSGGDAIILHMVLYKVEKSRHKDGLHMQSFECSKFYSKPSQTLYSVKFGQTTLLI